MKAIDDIPKILEYYDNGEMGQAQNLINMHGVDALLSAFPSCTATYASLHYVINKCEKRIGD